MLIKQGERLINARNWNELVKPDQILRDEDTASSTHGKFVCEPLERGYGTTIGNAMRRVLLASLQGAAFVSVKITGVQHEFTTIHGVLEDVTDVVLNIKQVRLRMDTDEPQRLTLRVDSKGPVTAAQIQANQHVTVLNPEQHIATLTEDVVLEMEFEVRMGKGYVPADMHEGLADEIGLILMAKAGYDPQAAIDFWSRFSEGKTPSWTETITSTHPCDADRIQQFRENLPKAEEYYRQAAAPKGKGVIFR